MGGNKLWTIRFAHLLVIELVFQFATYMLNPVISGYVITLGASLTVAGFVAGLVATSALVVRPVTGWVADKLSKTTLLVVAATLFAVAAFGCALTSSVMWLSVFRAVQGVAFAFRSAVVMSLVSVVVASDHLGRAVGWIGVATTVSSAVAPTLAALMESYVGYHACFFSAALLFSVGLILAVLLKASGDKRDRHWNRPPSSEEHMIVGLSFGTGRFHGVRLRDFVYIPGIPYSVMAALTGAPHGINVSLMLAVGDARGIEGVSLYFAAYAVAALVARPIVGRVCDVKGFDKVMVPVVSLELVGVACLATMDSLVWAVVAGVFIGVGQGSAYSALQAESVRYVRPEESGKASNTYYIGPDVNMGLSPLIGGFVMQTFGVTTMYAVCFVAVTSVFPVLHFMSKNAY